MPIITIPRTLAQKDDLIIIPRKEYESLIRFKKIEEFLPTIAQKRALTKAENNFKKGRALSYDELISGLGLKG